MTELAGRDISHLLTIMRRLRDRETGCPWDIQQNFASIAPYTVEEAHEVADAIARNDLDDLCEELGDLLLQVVFHAQMAEEAGAFTFGDVVLSITEKMVRRHPHVFGDADAKSPDKVKSNWAQIKAQEKALRAAKRAARGLPPEERGAGLLGSVGRGLPAFEQAIKLQEKAATVGFDWGDVKPVLAKIREEIDEIEAEIDHAVPDKARTESELGDILFAVANLARHLKTDPEQALRGTNNRFRARFGQIESYLAAEGKKAEDQSLETLEALWVKAKKALKAE